MAKRHWDVVANVCEEMLDGTQATCRGPLTPRLKVLDLSSALVQRIGGSRMDCAQLADLMTACYHLGREQALQRVAIGLDSVAMETPDGSGERPDGYDNVPVEEETVCLGDEPRPPSGLCSECGTASRLVTLTVVDGRSMCQSCLRDYRSLSQLDEPKPPHDPGCYRPDGRLGPCSHDYPPPPGAQGRTRAERLAEVDPKEWTK